MAKDADKKRKQDEEDLEEISTEADDDEALEGDEESEADEDDEDEDEDEDDDDEDEDDEDEDEDEDEDDEPAEVAPTTGAAKTADALAAPTRGRPLPRRRRKRGNPTRNIVLFVALVGGLAFAFAALGNSRSGGGGPTPRPKWKAGQVVDAEITLVTTDFRDLGCAMKEEVNGRYCAFIERNQKRPKPADARKADKLLQPYTTTERVQFMASGLWMQPELVAKLEKENLDRPSPRFSVKCKFHVEAASKDAYVQWKPGEGWHPANDWHVGYVDNCHISE